MKKSCNIFFSLLFVYFKLLNSRRHSEGVVCSSALQQEGHMFNNDLPLFSMYSDFLLRNKQIRLTGHWLTVGVNVSVNTWLPPPTVHVQSTCTIDSKSIKNPTQTRSAAPTVVFITSVFTPAINWRQRQEEEEEKTKIFLCSLQERWSISKVKSKCQRAALKRRFSNQVAAKPHDTVN